MTHPPHNSIKWNGNNFHQLAHFIDDDTWRADFQSEGLFNLINLKTNDVRTYFAGVTFYKFQNILTVKLE